MSIQSFSKLKPLRIVIRLLIVLLIVAMGVWGMADVFTGYRAQDLVTVGRVNVASESYRSDLNEELSRISRQTGTLVTLEDARRMGIDQLVFDRIVNTAVIDDTANRLGLAIGHDEIVKEVMASPNFQNSDGTFNRERFNSVLSQNGLSEAAFLANETSNRLRRSVSELPASSLALPRAVTESLMRYRQEIRDARYFTLKINEADVPAASEDEIAKQYAATPAAYTAPEYRSVAIMTIQPADIAGKLSVTEEEIKAAYDRSKREFFTPEKRTVLQLSLQDKAKLEEAKKKIDGGADFLTVAKEFGKTEAEVTAADRGKTDFLDSKVAEAAFSLAEGAVSGLVEGDLAITLVKVVKISPESQQSLEDVREVLTQRVKDDRASEEISAIYDAAETARGEGTSFESIAEKAGIPSRIIPAVDATGRDKSGKLVHPPLPEDVLKRAFASDVSIQEDAIGWDKGFIWYEVREIVPSALKPLADVREAVVADVKASRMRALVEKKAKDLIAAAGTTTKIETLAQQASAEVKSATGIKRIDVSAELDGLATLAIFAAKPNTLTYAVDADGGSAKIIEVTKVETPVMSTVSTDAKEIMDTARQGLEDDFREVYLKAARQSADLTINEELWQTIRGGSTTTP